MELDLAMTTTRFLSLLALTIVTGADPAAAAPPAPTTDKLGSRIEHLPLRAADGRDPRPADARATVIVFLSYDCPVSSSYATALAKLAAEYGPKGAAFVGVCPTDDAAGDVERKAKEFKIGFPVVKDAGAAAALKAAVTPEAFVIDGHQVLRYRG